ncbi:MAG: hydroxymethylglutaryl-CoA reductase, partial [Bacteroidota bacterium]
ERGGFKAEVIDTRKIGQVHFSWSGEVANLQSRWEALHARLLADTEELTANMRRRGGGILHIELIDGTHLEPNYYQLKAEFETCDSMGANFINTVLESFGTSLQNFVAEQADWSDEDRNVQVIMAILSNYTPDCLVRATVSCPVSELGSFPGGMSAEVFADKFAKAVRIAQLDPYRATTHNKGIFNGIDAVVLATGNDFRAIEACGHTYAARDGQYRSLSSCTIENGIFTFSLEIPLALGTVGGLTKLHPIAKRSLELLGHPRASELMEIIAATGLAQNFAAVRSLVTTGIQQGHMKMHLQNILAHLGASQGDRAAATKYFIDKPVSFSSVRAFLERSPQEEPLESNS